MLKPAYPMCNIGAGEGWLRPPSNPRRSALRQSSRAGGSRPFPPSRRGLMAERRIVTAAASVSPTELADWRAKAAAAGGAGARGRPLSGSTSSLPITLENARHTGMGRLAQELAPPHPPGCPSVRQPRRPAISEPANPARPARRSHPTVAGTRGNGECTPDLGSEPPGQSSEQGSNSPDRRTPGRDSRVVDESGTRNLPSNSRQRRSGLSTLRRTSDYFLFTTQPSPPKGCPPMFTHFLGLLRVTSNRTGASDRDR